MKTVQPKSTLARQLTDEPVRRARAQFPALERMHNGYPVAYFDGPGGTQVPRSVADAMTQYLFHHNANTHWVYPTSEETDALIAESRRTIATFLNAEPDEVAFGANMTTLTFHLARALGRQWKTGDEVIVTDLDHHGNVAPWRALEKERGIVIKSVRFDPLTGELDIYDLIAKVGPRTKLLALGIASNALGTITDPVFSNVARQAGAEVFIDAVHYAPHRAIDVKQFDCDYLACSAYKFYGPHIGILYGKKSKLEAIDFPKLDPAPNESPERVETGTQNHEGIVGAAAAVEFIASLAEQGTELRERLEDSYQYHYWHGRFLLERLWKGLQAIDGLTIYGPPADNPDRTPTLSFTLRGHKTNDIARALAKKGVFVSNGDFYAMTVIERIGQAADGVVRVGCSCYTTEEEVDRVIEGVREIARAR
jgi:cysteine desulfurase family protein (TIGR01976 family)